MYQRGGPGGQPMYNGPSQGQRQAPMGRPIDYPSPERQRLGPPRQAPAPQYQQSRQQLPSQQRNDATPSVQWPLRDDSGAQPTVSTSQQRGPPPQRPPRPDPSQQILRPPPVSNRGPPVSQVIPPYRQEPAAPITQYAQHPSDQWADEPNGSPTYRPLHFSGPLTPSSRASTSSNYSLPDFPIPQLAHMPPLPQQPPQQIRRAPLGPPPSARRGPASYYPQSTYVPPIVEETDSQRGSQRGTHDSHGSYASSNAIPIGIPDYYLDEGRATLTDDESPFDEQGEDSDYDEHVAQATEHPGLVRQASIGKRSRPQLTTIKSGDSLRSENQPMPSIAYVSAPDSDPTQDSSSGYPMREKKQGPALGLSGAKHLDTSTSGLTVRTDSSGILPQASAFDSSSSSEKSLSEKRSNEFLSAPPEYTRSRSPLAPKEQKGVGMNSSNALDSAEQTSLAKRVGSKRPPRLNVDVVKEAEARGSLTSLPDLIRRATKLASNLDRGKTASRFGMGWFDEERYKSDSNSEKRRSGSISDILASFPPPALATPPGSRGSRALTNWPSHLRHSALPSESDMGEVRPRRKRCCGMPLWVFLLLLLLVLMLVAAAVVVPVMLIVVPRQRNAERSDSASALASCAKSLQCQNGGTNIVGSNGGCSCLCVNGFTGTQCSEASTTGCATMDVDAASNATVGSAIPRLVEAAGTNFTVPLNGSAIVALFSANNLSCSTENALVTFGGLSSRSLTFNHGVSEDKSSRATPVLKKRQNTSSATGAAVTSNGIVFESGSPTSTSTASGASSTASTSSLSSYSSLSTTSSNTTTLDFARVAVLFVLQNSGQLSDAATAQENLQAFFSSGTTSTGQKINAANMTLSGSYTANLDTHSIVVPNGTTVGM